MAVINSTVQNTTAKKTTNLPLQDPNNPNQALQLNANNVQPIGTQPQQTPGAQAANQSLLQVNQMAQQGFQSPTVQLTSLKTQELLKDPSQGKNYQQNINNQLSQFDRESAQSLETARQGMAGAAGSSINQQALMELALKNNESKADLRTDLESQAADQKQKAYLAALAEGRATAQTEQNQFNTNIDALVKARQAADSEMVLSNTSAENALNRGLELAKANQNAALQTSLAELDAKIKQGLQLSEQDFTASQNELNRALQTSLQANDLNSTRANLETQLAFDKWKTESGYQFTAEQNALNRTLETSLKYLDINSAKELAELKGKIDAGLMTKEQDWTSAENALNRAAQAALQENDTKAQIEIVKLQGEIESAKQKAMQEWSTSERIATQAFTTEERISTQDFDKTMQYLKQQQELAIQANDISTQKYLADQQVALQLKMQTQGFDQQTKMAYLQAELEDAKANKDVDRQKAIIQFQTSQEIERMAAQTSYDAALEQVRGDIQMALQNDDQIAAEALQKTELTFRANEAAKDRALEKARVDLEAKQVDMAQVEQQYSQIADMVAQGILDPSAEYDFLMGTLEAHGIDTSGPEYKVVDSQAQAQKALQQEYDLQKAQFVLTHPEYVQYTIPKDSIVKVGNMQYGGVKVGNSIYTSIDQLKAAGIDPKTVPGVEQTMTADGAKAFNEFINSALYGELTAEQKKAKETAGYLGAGDLGTAGPEDKFYFESAVNYNGKTIPPGKYSVRTYDVGHGNKIWGTAYTNTHVKLVNEQTGEEYEIKKSKSGTKGNLISGLWADEGGLLS